MGEMKFKAHVLAMELLWVIDQKEWDRANELVGELQKVLDTYKRSC